MELALPRSTMPFTMLYIFHWQDTKGWPNISGLRLEQLCLIVPRSNKSTEPVACFLPYLTAHPRSCRAGAGKGYTGIVFSPCAIKSFASPPRGGLQHIGQAAAEALENRGAEKIGEKAEAIQGAKMGEAPQEQGAWGGNGAPG